MRFRKLTNFCEALLFVLLSCPLIAHSEYNDILIEEVVAPQPGYLIRPIVNGEPATNRPGVVLLGGSEGGSGLRRDRSIGSPNVNTNTHISQVAQEFAKKGFVTFVFHYIDSPIEEAIEKDLVPKHIIAIQLQHLSRVMSWFKMEQTKGKPIALTGHSKGAEYALLYNEALANNDFKKFLKEKEGLSIDDVTPELVVAHAPAHILDRGHSSELIKDLRGGRAGLNTSGIDAIPGFLWGPLEQASPDDTMERMISRAYYAGHQYNEQKFVAPTIVTFHGFDSDWPSWPEYGALQPAPFQHWMDRIADGHFGDWSVFSAEDASKASLEMSEFLKPIRTHPAKVSFVEFYSTEEEPQHGFSRKRIKLIDPKTGEPRKDEKTGEDLIVPEGEFSRPYEIDMIIEVTRSVIGSSFEGLF